MPVEWLEKLAEEGRVLYLEQGLWIAAEQQAQYEEALGPARSGAADIVRRMLRYRGGATVGQTARRYGWTEEETRLVLEELCRREEAVAQEELCSREEAREVSEAREGEARAAARMEKVYYHAQVYRRARIRTLKNRREEIATCPPENYAALLLSRIQRSAPPQEALGRPSDPLRAWHCLRPSGRNWFCLPGWGLSGGAFGRITRAGNIFLAYGGRQQAPL